MRSKFTWVITLFLVLFVQVGFAQQKQISGVVKNEYGDPMEGASVKLVGTNEGTETNYNGAYSINAKKGDRIEVQFMGFTTLVLRVSDTNILNFTLKKEG